MHKIRVGVIRGGPSEEYDVSLETGSLVLSSMPEKYYARDILIDRVGIWYMNGLEVTPHEALTHIDVAFNALHGKYGEDGKIQHIFETHGIPFTGSGSFASVVGINKNLSKDFYKKEKIKTPQSKLIESLADVSAEVHKIFYSFPLPVVVKPISSGSSIGITIVKDFSNFESAVRKAFEYGNAVLIEEFIKGREASCVVIDKYREHELYALPVAEIRPHNGEFFDYEAKYHGKSDEIVPGNFLEKEKKEIEALAISAHRALGLRHYSRSDFIIHPKRGIFILETNTLPGLSKESLLPKSLKAVGSNLSHFIDHVIQLAISGK